MLETNFQNKTTAERSRDDFKGAPVKKRLTDSNSSTDQSEKSRKTDRKTKCEDKSKLPKRLKKDVNSKSTHEKSKEAKTSLCSQAAKKKVAELEVDKNKREKKQGIFSEMTDSELIEKINSHPIIKQQGVRLIKKIGGGGFSIVFMAKCDQTPTKLLAAKVLKVDDTNKEKLEAKIKKEGNIQKYLTSKYSNFLNGLFKIDGILSSDMKQYIYIFISELEVNGDLDLYRKVRLKTSFVRGNLLAYISYQLANIVNHLYKAKIVHLDIKNANIFINASHNFKIGDFSISETFSEMENFKFNGSGTTTHMSPEQLKRETISGKLAYKTDLWAIGVVLYKLAYDKLPFDIQGKEDSISTYRRIHSNSLAFEDDLGEDFESLIKGLLEIDIEKRLSIENLLDHPFIQSGKDVYDQKECYSDVNKFIDDLIREYKEDFSSIMDITD